MRRIILFSVLLISLGAIAYTFFSTSSHKAAESSALAYISDDALLVLEVDDAKKFHEQLASGSVLWPVATEIPGPLHFEELLTGIDSLLRPYYAKAPGPSFSYSLSLHPQGQKSRSWLLVIPRLLEASNDIASLMSANDLMPELFKQYEGTDIYKSTEEGKTYFVARKEGALMLSTSDLCLEKQLRNKGRNITERNSFTASRSTRSNQSPAHLHIDWKAFGPHLGLLFGENDDEHFKSDLGSWATSDFITDANSIYLNGLIQAPDSLSLYLNRFDEQGAGDFDDFLELIPTNTSSFVFTHISDFSQWSSESIQRDSILESALGQGLVSFTIEGESNESYLVRISDNEEVRNWLDQFGSPSDALGFEVIDAIPSEKFAFILNNNKVDSTYSAVLFDRFLMFSSDESSLRQILLQVKSNRTLAEDEAFDQLQDDLDDKASLLYYFNIARLSDQLAEKEFNYPLERLSASTEALKNFQALVIQYEPAGDASFHQQVLLRHNPVYKKETSSIWELALSRPIIGDIHGVKNHYNGQYEILVQDDSLSVHLIDNKGDILWTKRLNERILSDVEQIDIFKNGKLQMIFNTSTAIHLLDRNGRDVDGFPIALPDTASTFLGIMDYDRNKNYRLLIGLQDGQLMNYGTDGKAVKGWKHKAGNEPLIGHIRHFTIGKKDYITTIGASGTLQFLERNGKVRFGGVKTSLPSYDGGFYRIRPGKNIENSSIVHRNRQGELLITKVKGPSEILDESARIHPLKADRFFRTEGGRYTLFNSKMETRLDIRTDIDETNVQVDDQAYTGLVDRDSGLYYLYDNSGELLKGFPLPGIMSYIGDMNKDSVKDIVLTDAEGVIYMYSLD